jgi:hypothetical protein
VLSQAKDLHLLADGGLNDFLEGIFGMARAELARVAVVGEWHCVYILFLSPGSWLVNVHVRLMVGGGWDGLAVDEQERERDG